ncbi:hypothetical protein ZWY2020_046423, partial [Hordeum vulgare]
MGLEEGSTHQRQKESTDDIQVESQSQVNGSSLRNQKRNKKEAEDRVLQLDFFSGSVAAVNMDLHNKIEVLENENKKAEDNTEQGAESEMESVGAENRNLKDQLQAVEVQAMKLKYFSEKVAGVNMVLHL